MLRSHWLVALLSISFSGTAYASDLPAQNLLPAKSPLPFWNGFYIGGYSGGAIGKARLVDQLSASFTNGNLLAPEGFIGPYDPPRNTYGTRRHPL